VQGIAACTVIAPTCAESDGWATACFVYGPERSLQQLGDKLAIRFTLLPGVAAAPLKIIESAGFPAPTDEPGP